MLKRKDISSFFPKITTYEPSYKREKRIFTELLPDLPNEMIAEIWSFLYELCMGYKEPRPTRKYYWKFEVMCYVDLNMENIKQCRSYCSRCAYITRDDYLFTLISWETYWSNVESRVYKRHNFEVEKATLILIPAEEKLERITYLQNCLSIKLKSIRDQKANKVKTIGKYQTCIISKLMENNVKGI